jgi:hypothetical protein
MQKAAIISRHVLVAGFCKTKPTGSHLFQQMIRARVLMNESSKHPRAYVQVMEGAVCTAGQHRTAARPKGLARSRARWKHGLFRRGASLCASTPAESRAVKPDASRLPRCSVPRSPERADGCFYEKGRRVALLGCSILQSFSAQAGRRVELIEEDGIRHKPGTH